MDRACPIIGMIPGNSYFKDGPITHLLTEAITLHGRAVVFIPDVPAIATYRAYGYTEKKARSKAILKGNNLKNRTRHIQTQLGHGNDIVRIVDWEKDVADQPSYVTAYTEVRNLYGQNKAFASAVRAATKAVLKVGADNVAVETAVDYILSELAFLECAPKFFGAEKIIYFYHRPWPVYQEYIAGKYDGIRRSHLDFRLIEAA